MDTIGSKIYLTLLFGAFFASCFILYRSYVPAGSAVNNVSSSFAEVMQENETALSATPSNSQTGLPNTLILDYETPGNAVIVDRVSLGQGGFVAVFRDESGAPGRDVGHSELLTGAQENVVVYISEPMNVGEVLWARLIGDDGDGQYENPGEDQLLTDELGENVELRFEVREE